MVQRCYTLCQHLKRSERKETGLKHEWAIAVRRKKYLKRSERKETGLKLCNILEAKNERSYLKRSERKETGLKLYKKDSAEVKS
ncbi:hypothetical protein [Plectonema radiosum]|uniref:hypothetical protein n=1 Tax=Plectonema radiosum TaxID=945768 RepID=UPI0040556B20